MWNIVKTLKKTHKYYLILNLILNSNSNLNSNNKPFIFFSKLSLYECITCFSDNYIERKQ